MALLPETHDIFVPKNSSINMTCSSEGSNNAPYWILYLPRYPNIPAEFGDTLPNQHGFFEYQPQVDLETMHVIGLFINRTEGNNGTLIR